MPGRDPCLEWPRSSASAIRRSTKCATGTKSPRQAAATRPRSPAENRSRGCDNRETPRSRSARDAPRYTGVRWLLARECARRDCRPLPARNAWLADDQGSGRPGLRWVAVLAVGRELVSVFPARQSPEIVLSHPETTFVAGLMLSSVLVSGVTASQQPPSHHVRTAPRLYLASTSWRFRRPAHDVGAAVMERMEVIQPVAVSPYDFA
jgi:hypothetical protein